MNKEKNLNAKNAKVAEQLNLNIMTNKTKHITLTTIALFVMVKEVPKKIQNLPVLNYQ